MEERVRKVRERLVVAVGEYAGRALDEVDDVLLEGERLCAGVVPLHGLPVLGHEELLEVPAHVRQQEAVVVQAVLVGKPGAGGRAPALEESEERELVLSVDLRLGEHLEVGLEAASGPHVGDAVQDLRRVGARLLQTKLIAWKTEDSKVIPHTGL